MKSILMKPEMHLAVRENRKTITRRLDGLKEINKEPDDWRCYKSADGKYWIAHRERDKHQHYPKPRYKVDDVVYIKEAWATEKQYDHLKPSEIPHSAYIHFVADGVGDYPLCIVLGRLRSPLFMPSWAARYFIQITDVRAERLQEITFEDCLAEGVVSSKEWQSLDYKAPEPLHPEDLSNEEADNETERGWEAYTRQVYSLLWNSINAKRGYGWEKNHWVWVISFKRIDKNSLNLNEGVVKQ